MSSNGEKPPENENDKKNSSSKEDSPSDDKEDGGSASTGSNGGATTGEPSQPGSKPSSVGATVREKAQKLLSLATRREWAVVGQLLNSLEKAVQSAGEDDFIVPLAGVLDTTTGMTPLMYAVEDNRSELLDRMIELGSDVNARNNATIDKGKIPLLLAIEAGNQSICRKLLAHQQASDQLCATTPAGDSAVHLATRRKNIDMVQILLDYGAAVNMQNGDGQTALHIASAEGDKTLVKYLYDIRASASITDYQDRTPMHLAAENGHATIIELLADKFNANIFERTKDGSTLMHIASLNGHSECVTMLLKKGLYLHMPNKRGARSIHIAAEYGHVGIISTLLQRGEKVDATTNDAYTALHIAVENIKPAVVETLLGYGAKVHVRGGKLRETPLHIAARVADSNECVLILLQSGANPNLTINDGQTPVHVAASHGNLATLLLLLDNDGDPMFKSKKGETPLHLACRSCRTDVVRYLIEFVKKRKGSEVATAYVNSLTNEGGSALHYAAQIEPSKVGAPGDDRAIIRILLNSRADVSLQTRQAQESAFHHCALVGNNEVLTEMISRISATEVQKALNRQSAVGWTPLLIAAHRGHMELVTTLLANHGRVDVFDLEGRFALHLAAEHGYLQVCDTLLANKDFINYKSHVGKTALHLAAMNGYTHLVQFLVQDHRAEIDVLTMKKQTPLHLAAEAGQLDVCNLLLELGASIGATDDQGQKPIHAAVMNNYIEVAQLFLQRYPSMMLACTNDGNTCAHIAAMQANVRMIEELMKFDRKSTITARNKLTEATPLQLAAEGGHAEVVKALVRAGASCADENRAGFTAVHLAAQHGYCHVLEVMRSSQSFRISSKKLGVTALHVAAYFGQADMVRELLTHIPGTVKSDPPTGGSLVRGLGAESGMTPLHLAACSGNEKVVQFLLNSADVQVNAATTENGWNPLHLACFGGYVTIVGLLLRRSAELLHSSDHHGRTGLHIAAMVGHFQIVEILLGQEAEINATDKNGWTPLHCAAYVGHLDIVKLLVDSYGSPKIGTNLCCAPIWIAASEGHNNVLKYLMEKEHDKYALMEDRKFVYNMMVCSKSHDNKLIEEFILMSPAPIDIAAKLSNIYMKLSGKETVRAKDLITAGKQCEAMGIELLTLAAGINSADKILTSMDQRNVEFLDVLIENEQKDIIAHTVVQRYLKELWQGSLNWNTFKTILLFIAFIVCPPVWIMFALPLGYKYNNVPIIKFMTYFTSHIYLMVCLLLVSISPIAKTYHLVTFDGCLLVLLIGFFIFEIALKYKSDKFMLNFIKVMVLMFEANFPLLHWISLLDQPDLKILTYLINQLFAFHFLLASVQVINFLSFHHLFGPWAIIIGNLMKDLARFLVLLAIFIFGFAIQFIALHQPLNETNYTSVNSSYTDTCGNLCVIEFLFFAIFGQTTYAQFNQDGNQPDWASVLFKLVYGIYILVTVVMLINLLIATMSNTYLQIQAQSDIEWKYRLSKRIQKINRTTRVPPPLNLFMWIPWIMWFFVKLYKKSTTKQQQLLSSTHEMNDYVDLSVAHSSSLGTQLSFHNAVTIENVVDWDVVRRKYRHLYGEKIEQKLVQESEETIENALAVYKDTSSFAENAVKSGLGLGA
ncbi:PREDICTED: serine/threonine-protein phosphatase 6 regulatory ankyrin repeat subunit B [Wasmannia auropunctata]|uniref:serine/threonine-protein phosphatase 6 regulatory ankyrin repeat subunit B n=1 Tax=Wasmannia auropunctata TaxID=64793 RepID=UPI0005EFB68A|nr:PREDICTED: serine/threonine-protein phosphatase 6 regulatory ankyrin repeat subunit B [Wasmannia auropunctata]